MHSLLGITNLKVFRHPETFQKAIRMEKGRKTKSYLEITKPDKKKETPGNKIISRCLKKSVGRGLA